MAGMKTVVKFKYVLIIAGVLILLMVIRTVRTGAWKGDAGQAGETVESGSCFVDFAGLKGSGENIHLLRIGDSGSDSLFHALNLPQTRLAFTDLKPGTKLKELRSSGNRLVIVAASRQEGIKAWVILHQLGLNNLYILSHPNGNDEVLKYQFRPDSSFRPEPETGEN
jgi:hypothetical protein